MRPSSPSSPSHSQAARSLATPISPDGSPHPQSPAAGGRPSWPRTVSTSTRLPQWTVPRRSSSMMQSTPLTRPPGRGVRRGSSSVFDSEAPQAWHARLVQRGVTLAQGAWRLFLRLTLLQQVLVGLVALGMLAGGVVLLVFGEKLYEGMYGYAERFGALPGSWAIMWAFIVATAFPPLMGYSTAVTMCGFIWGMKGWLIVATANVVGSTLSFVVFRRYLSNISAKIAARDNRFAAFNLVLQRDGLPLLVAIRLCPLPYSLSNAALSTLPPVRTMPFAIATACASPKLLIHVFIGDRLAALMRGGGEGMDPVTKAANYLGIAAGVVVGIATGVVIYRRTVARARQLEAEMLAEEEGLGGDFEGADDGDGEAELGAKPLLRQNGSTTQEAGSGLQHPDAFVDEQFDDSYEDAWGHDEDEQREQRDEINFLHMDGAKDGGKGEG